MKTSNLYFNNLEPCDFVQWPITIMFHSSYPIINKGDIFHSWNSTTSKIKSIINFLSEKFDIIDEKAFSGIIESGRKNAEGKVLITFDDGYKSVYQELFDFLNKKEIKPTVFLTSGFFQKQIIPWYIRLALLFRHSQKKNFNYKEKTYNINDFNDRFSLFNKINIEIKELKKEAFKKNFESLFEQSDLNITDVPIDKDMELLSKEDVAKLINEGWGIGSHCVTHWPLSSLSEDEIEQELAKSKNDLESILGSEIYSVSYPHGSCNKTVLDKTKQYYKTGFLAVPDSHFRSNYEIPRIGFPESESIIRNLCFMPPKREYHYQKAKKHLQSGLVKKAFTLFSSAPFLLSDKNERKLFVKRFYHHPQNKQLSKNIEEIQGVDLSSSGLRKNLEPCGKRVVILCGPGVPERKAVAEIGKSFNLCGVIIHKLVDHEINLFKCNISGANGSGYNEVSSCLFPYLNYENEPQKSLLGSDSLGWFVPKHTEVISAKDINDPMIVDILRKLNPDIMFVFGTGIIRNKDILSVDIPTYNLHWGLSPYFRGSFTERWPIYENRISAIGVTIHELDPGIDSGPIVAQKRPSLDGSETALEIEYKVSIEGIKLIKDIIRSINDGKRPSSYPQNLEQGKFYSVKKWSAAIDLEVENKLADGFIYKNSKRINPNKTESIIELDKPF